MKAPNHNTNDTKYRSLVIDSGPIIKLTGVSALRDKADQFYTVPAVLTEIRDAKARDHLQNLPFDIVTREPSSDSINAVAAFSRLTGDYRSLSKVDLLVLALVYELEKEGCNGSVEHIRTEPKRTVGIGKVELLNPNPNTNNNNPPKQQEEEKQAAYDNDDGCDIEYDIVEDEDEDEKEKENEVSFFEGKPKIHQEEEGREEEKETPPAGAPNSSPKSWALLVNPSAAGKTVAIPLPPPGTLNLKTTSTTTTAIKPTDAGQFSDAEEEGEEEEEERQHKQEGDQSDSNRKVVGAATVEEELQIDFPSLAASLYVPFEGEDREIEQNSNNKIIKGETKDTGKIQDDTEDNEDNNDDEEQRKKDALKPLSKSGKTYNSFRGYKELFKPAAKKKTNDESNRPEPLVEEQEKVETITEDTGSGGGRMKEMEGQSRIIGGITMSGQEVDIEDDGEGWVTCTSDIRSLQAAGTLAPPKNDLDDENNKQGPAISQRTACATTDFAMQNVILQMNLELLSVDGVKIRRLKTWVTRCGACFKVYTKNDDAGPHGMKRLFCERCGSDMLQRIAASVDGKTGRLRLHMSKKGKHCSSRGTKFSLPKAGTGNRFQGDLLLREDQLLMGAWNQKVKMRSGGKAKSAAQSMFGHDIAANVGCRAKSMKVDDIAAGFGRRNPNSSKGGRERRGKKKKSKDKACGLRRYH